MSVQTVLLDFSIEPVRVNSDVECKIVVKSIIESLKKYFADPVLIFETTCGDGFMSLFKEGNTVITVRCFQQGLITLNIEYFKKDLEEGKISFDNIKNLENNLSVKLDSKRSKHLPPIKRGGKIDYYLTSSDPEINAREIESTLVQKLELSHGQSLPAIQRGPLTKYFPTADERIIEYDIDKVVFDKRSPFQKIQIVHSKSLGHMLVLDELQNIAEADLIYTETLMQRGIENYKDKEICILGGGDGALLYELLKEQPKYVVMLEIDEMVMQACNKYMNSICGDVLEQRKGDNYEIIVGDCMVYLDKYIKEGKKFDYVFGDLTDIPITDTPSGEIWDFIRTIQEASFKVLKKDGKFMTHGNGTSCPESLKMYEDQLNKLSSPVKFTKAHAFVPSFMEDWIFYQVSFANQE
uniref:CSON000359 protein n=1 Tax=Culicoides sonorensis TaxID=179676 RepID=A0A336MEA3_CULSO